MFVHHFCTPVSFTPTSKPSLREKLINLVDDYFHLQGSIFIVNKPSNPLNPFIYTGILSSTISLNPKELVKKILILTVKIISYITLIIPLIMLLAKYLLRHPYIFIFLPEDDDAISITPSNRASITNKPVCQDLITITSSLRTILPLALNKQIDKDIFSSYKSTHGIYDFELTSFPNFVFKTADNNESVKAAFSNMQMVENLIKTKDYDKVIVPQSQIVQINLPNNKTRFCIIKEKIDFPKDHTTNYLGWPITPAAYGWLEHDEELRPAIAQIASIIQESGLSDIYYRNAPAILHNGKWKICLLNTDGDRRSFAMVRYNLLQLVQCASSTESIQTIIDSCNPELTLEKDIKPLINDLKKKKIKRSEELIKIHSHKNDYKQMQIALWNINNPFKPLTIDSDSLGLDLTQTALTPDKEIISIKDVLNAVIAALNKELRKKSKEPLHQYDNHQYDNHRLINFPAYSYSKKDKDYISLSLTSEDLSNTSLPLLNWLGLTSEEIIDFKALLTLIKTQSQHNNEQIDQAIKYQKKTWLFQIFTALQAKGYIFYSGYNDSKEIKLLLSPQFKVKM